MHRAVFIDARCGLLPLVLVPGSIRDVARCVR